MLRQRARGDTDLPSDSVRARWRPTQIAHSARRRFGVLGSAASADSMAVLILYQICGTAPKNVGRVSGSAAMSCLVSATVVICRPVARLV